MKRLLPRFGALALVAALVGAVVWLRPEPPGPAPAPQEILLPEDFVLQYADGSRMWSSSDGPRKSYLVSRVLAELKDQGLSFDQLRSSRSVVRTTIDAKAQTVAAAVVGRLVAPRRPELGAAVAAIDPASGDVRVYLGLSRGADLAGDEAKELPPEIVRPFTDVGAPNLVRARMSPLDLASAYGTFAAGGVRQEPRFVTSVSGGDGAELYRKVGIGHVPFDRQVADRVTAQLKERPGCNGVACVPGAHQWTAGYTPKLAVTVFVDKADAVADADLARVVWQEFLSSLAG
ncbi:hypothetical protein G7043_10270 [Lentzea sp. NEAU-D13]|uniref:Beta-lactamase enzyme family protein n=1 Tax=Lentzea alba TaxID=2714351 RepID=A0A7C9RP23_9PSEU|nr:hypothetical protein [Lentzea alba]NGY59308.1 hypothetical protein [Lentzea alba]